MLNKRVHILFDQKLWNKLLKMAKEENISVGKVVRSAVEDKVSKEKESEKRKKAVKEILSFRDKYGKKLAKGEDSTALIRRMREERYGSKR